MRRTEGGRPEDLPRRRQIDQRCGEHQLEGDAGKQHPVTEQPLASSMILQSTSCESLQAASNTT